MTLKQKLLSKLPSSYSKYIEDFVRENGLIEHCSFMLYFTELGYEKGYGLGYHCIPIKSIDEAVGLLKEIIK